MVEHDLAAGQAGRRIRTQLTVDRAVARQLHDNAGLARHGPPAYRGARSGHRRPPGMAMTGKGCGARPRSALRPVPGGEDNLARHVGADAELLRYLGRPEPLLVVDESESFLP